MTPAIDVRGAFRIHRSTTGGSAVALQGLSLQVGDGEIVVVLGPSGAGKTTLLRTVAGFEQLAAGSAIVLGEDVTAMPPPAAARFRARQLGLLDQHYARALSPDLSCLHSVALSLELLGRSRRDAREAAAALLARVGLGDRLEARPTELSGGEQQRVALCAALAHRPRLLLADEPAGELDARNAAEIYGLIAELVGAAGGSALIVSHDETAAEIASRLVHVHDGRVVEERVAGEESQLVVNDPGWVRIPDGILEELGRPQRLHGGRDGGRIVLAAASTPTAAASEASLAGRARPEPMAELRAVVKRYPSARRPVLDGLTYVFASSTLTAVVGRSGSGKTTLLHLLAGLDLPDSGDVVVCGLDLVRASRPEAALYRRRHVEVVTQEPGLVPHLTALENVELALRIREAEGRAGEALAAVGLAARLAHRADRLSAGERQRVAIARALAARPAVLLADEPTARLDRKNAAAVAEMLLGLSREVGSAVIVATHDEALIERADETLTLAAVQPAGVASRRLADARPVA